MSTAIQGRGIDSASRPNASHQMWAVSPATTTQGIRQDIIKMYLRRRDASCSSADGAAAVMITARDFCPMTHHFLVKPVDTSGPK
ncbi:hypothetical protein H074_31507 [Amycolatopsis decaplanina DSM 44594]|uniref:Uncharacterized protein n=1 Tax=Amycolatopsis decaplanina DSM 44594 TaxID=1284240 RepID=M2XUN2_9PSEU|nr:hypothetical protein H074_31507 [Amycolatopsis decaplanina DSM 44594]